MAVKLKAKWIQSVYNFSYTGGEQTFTAPATGYYKLEVWGAQGGYYSFVVSGGYGAYSSGEMAINKNEILYVNVGGAGTSPNTGTGIRKGGYNGGGDGYNAQYYTSAGGGGGATHIAKKSGVLSSLSGYKESVIIVAGGGGGIGYNDIRSFTNAESAGGNGGGYGGGTGTRCGVSGCSSDYSHITNIQKGGTQNDGYAFGMGESATSSHKCPGGGGGGWYGGKINPNASCNDPGGGGGSGYINKSILQNAIMYCSTEISPYDSDYSDASPACITSDSLNAHTLSALGVSADPVERYAKIGNGAARITYLRTSI